MNGIDFQLGLAATSGRAASAEKPAIAKQAETSEQKLKDVAQEFEALFLQEMLKSMRAASDAISKDGLFSSKQERFYRDWYDSLLAQDIAKKQGLGLADVIERQMSEKF